MNSSIKIVRLQLLNYLFLADELEQLEQMFLGKDTDNNNLDEE